MLPAVPDQWGVVEAHPLSDGIGGKVWRVRLSDGRLAALKQASEAALEDIDGSADFLRWADGDCSIHLLQRSGDLLLLEWAGDTTLQSHLDAHGDDSATEIAAEVLNRLHAQRDAAAPASLRTLENDFASLFAKARIDRNDVMRTQFVDAAECAQALLASQRERVPLHGDIHHENILLSPRGWLAIDPKGLVGEPAFDVANLFYNPLESELRFSETRALSMATILSRCVSIDTVRILDYAFAFSALSASWHAEDGNDEEAARSLAVGRTVKAARTQFTS